MRLLSPAKINLFLYVTGKRPDGYHDLCTLMCPIDLHDVIELDVTGSDIVIHCDHPDVPEGPSNLAYRAARLFFDRLGGRGTGHSAGVDIRITKQIPVAAGLGGGSGNAATVLIGLNHYFNDPFSPETLREMGGSIGADVPFFIMRKPVVATGIGEVLSAVGRLPVFHIVLVNSGHAVSTADVYRNLNLGLTNSQKINKESLFRVWKQSPARHLWNDLERVTVATIPEIQIIKEALLANGADGALMTGSGPTVFGLFFDRHRAQRAAEVLSRQERWRVFPAEPVLE